MVPSTSHNFDILDLNDKPIRSEYIYQGSQSLILAVESSEIVLRNKLVELRLVSHNDFKILEFYNLVPERKLVGLIKLKDVVNGSECSDIRLIDETEEDFIFMQFKIMEQNPELIRIKISGHTVGHWDIDFIISLSVDSHVFGIRLEARAAEKHKIVKFSFDFRTASKSKNRFTWAPQILPTSKSVVGPFSFRTPVIFYHDNTIGAAILPKITADIVTNPTLLSIEKNKDYDILGVRKAICKTVASMFCEESSIIGLGNEDHIEMAFDLVLLNSPQNEALNDITSYAWEKYVQEINWEIDHRIIDSLLRDSIDWLKKSELWFETIYHGTPIGGIFNRLYLNGTIDRRIFFGMPSNNLATGFGLKYFGKKWRNNALERKGDLIKELFISAPSTKGLFPTIYIASNGKRRWLNSQYNRKGFNSENMAWTGFWAIQWFKHIEQDKRLLKKVLNLGKAFLSAQLEDGSFPITILYDRHLKVVPETSLRSTAIVSLFLAELYEITRRPDFLDSANLAARRLILYTPFRKIKLNELSQKINIDSELSIQNVLDLFFASMVFKKLYTITKKEIFSSALSTFGAYFKLYQQLIDFPIVPISTFGGFGNSNYDFIWNDAKSALYSMLFLDKELDEESEEYQRGVAALNSVFNLTITEENNFIDEEILKNERLRAGILPYISSTMTEKIKEQFIDFNLTTGNIAAAYAMFKILSKKFPKETS